MGWLQDLVADADGQWRSAWLRACAIHAASARGVLERVDLVAARALGDPVIDEVLSSANADVGGIPWLVGRDASRAGADRPRAA